MGQRDLHYGAGLQGLGREKEVKLTYADMQAPRPIAILFASCVLAWAQPKPLALEPIHDSGQSVTGAFEGWFKNADGSFSILLGYFNRNLKEELDIPIGPNSALPALRDFVVVNSRIVFTSARGGKLPQAHPARLRVPRERSAPHWRTARA